MMEQPGPHLHSNGYGQRQQQQQQQQVPIIEPYSYRTPLQTLSLDADADTADDFFNQQCHEYYQSETQKLTTDIVIKQEILTPPAPEPVLRSAAMKKEFITPHPPGHRRRSMSVHIMESINIVKTEKSTVPQEKHAIKTNPDNEFVNSKRFGKSSSVTSLQSNPKTNFNYIPMAEQIYYSQRNTPERFRTRSRLQNFTFQHTRPKHLTTTIPHSPALLSKTRIRPITVPSQMELEEMEIQEIKKHKIKAHPISSAVLFGRINLPPIERRPKTKPDPFNLTEMKKKLPEKEEKFVFTARPIPKRILNKPFEVVKKAIPPTVPISPKITKKTQSLEHLSKFKENSQHVVSKQPKCPLQMAIKFEGIMKDMGSVGHTGVPLTNKTSAHPCVPIPFSFETRDKEREMKKLEKIKKTLEEEKRLREFKANPIPPSILKRNKSNDSSTPSPKQKKSIKKENKENCVSSTVFKARPPLVLHKEPFVPVRSNKACIETLPIELTTDKRAKERDAFNQKLKEKEEHLVLLRKIEEERKQQEAEREVAELRSHLVHKAAPIRHYAPLNIHSSTATLTDPKSPKFIHKH